MLIDGTVNGVSWFFRYLLTFAALSKMSWFTSTSECFSAIKPWPHYSITDIFKDPAIRSFMKHQYLDTQYAHSLAAEYIRRMPEGEFGNITLMHNIINEKFPESTHEGYVSIHLRLGDVLDGSSRDVDDILTSSPLPTLEHFGLVRPVFHVYAPNLMYYKNVISRLKKGTTSHVVFVGGSRDPDHSAKSCAYLRAVARLFISHGFSVEYRLGKTPDEDLAYLSRSSILVPSGGGFSKLASLLTRENGGQVLQANNDFCYDLYVPDGCPHDIQQNECCHASWTPPCCNDSSDVLLMSG